MIRFSVTLNRDVRSFFKPIELYLLLADLAVQASSLLFKRALVFGMLAIKSHFTNF
jgi:hypothetical protein